MAGWIRNTLQPTEALKRGKCQVSLKSQLGGEECIYAYCTRLYAIWTEFQAGVRSPVGVHVHVGVKNTWSFSPVLMKAAGFIAPSGIDFII